MGNAGVCSSCKSKEAEADEAGDEAPKQVLEEEGDSSPVTCPTSPTAASEIREWVLNPDAKLTVMMFGMTGAGKSALGNLIAGYDAFDYGDDTISVTNLESVMRYEAEDKSLVLLDTIGLGDTEIDQEKVVGSIRDVAVSAPRGVDVLLFVMRNARITDDAIARLIYATEYLWGSHCLLNLYIVITHASRYMSNKEEAKAWIERQAEINWRFKHIYKIVGENPNRFIFIDNPDPKSGEPGVEERRSASLSAVMRMLCLHPVDAVPPFTFSTMERARELTSKPEGQEEEQSAQADQDPGKDKPQRASRKKPDCAADPSPRAAPSTAVEQNAEAVFGMKQVLLKFREDKRLEEEAKNAVMDATLRFQQRWENQADGDAGAGAPSGEKGAGAVVATGSAASQPDGLRQACKRMASFILSKALPRRNSSKNASRTASAADSGAGSSGAAAVGASGEATSDVWERALSNILLRVRTSMSGTPEHVFKELDVRGSGSITPMEFTLFLREHSPNVTHQHVGGLWRRGDLNCDGQLDLEEFRVLFSPKFSVPSSPVRGSPPSLT